MDYEFTANLENNLDKVAQGEIDWRNVLDDFYTSFKNDLTNASDDHTGMRGNRPISTDVICPCGKTNMVIRNSSNGVFLGCSVVGLNFHWTVVFVRNMIQYKKVQPLNLIFYLTKFAISALVLFGAINYFEIPPLGLIIGLSNILLAVVTYSVINSMKRAPVQEAEENLE